jgi:glucose-1-phosphate adenylyltransferase
VIGYDHELDRKNGHHVTETGIVVVEGARTPVSVSEMVV